MDPADYQLNLYRLHMIASMVGQIPVEEMLNEHARAEALGPIINPTEFQTKGRAFREDGELMRLLMPLRKKMRELPNAQLPVRPS